MESVNSFYTMMVGPTVACHLADHREPVLSGAVGRERRVGRRYNNVAEAG